MQSRRESNTEATIAAILAVARDRFGRQGFESTGLEEIAAESRVTTGAIYHHFGSKQGLFRAVAEQIEGELLARALSAQDPDLWARTQKSLTALIEACATTEIQRIIFLDAPRVIGPEAWREIEMKYGYGAMSAVLTALAAAGIIQPYPVELVAPALLAVIAEASRARAANPAMKDDAAALLGRFLGALRVDRAPPSRTRRRITTRRRKNRPPAGPGPAAG
jgi:AcrR family transcriptional regulator